LDILGAAGFCALVLGLRSGATRLPDCFVARAGFLGVIGAWTGWAGVHLIGVINPAPLCR